MPRVDEEGIDWTEGERLLNEFVHAVHPQLASKDSDNDVVISREHAGELSRSFTAILEGQDVVASLNLKAGKRRVNPKQFRRQEFAACQVQGLLDSDSKMSVGRASEEVAGMFEERGEEVSARTIETWYRKIKRPEK